MGSFFKTFFAALLAMLIFTLIVFFIIVGAVGSLAKKEEPEVSAKSVLSIDLSKHFPEHGTAMPFTSLGEEPPPTLYEVVRLINAAKSDKNIAGIFIQADGNSNGFAASNEIRTALLDFKSSKKFIIAHGNTVSQSAYFVATAADKIYVNPTGSSTLR